ncbi:uncharacterized protein LOC101858755 [Aplysia californica]|uniref:Uncharacterized protein LOC101858755 n=1 Tax=Aplysia californica TaxID=6500 RepID=A0ABM1AD35_APLCA|nr:uncharacterized protein LOC101858755 [Aplysia californica]XP_012945404.1 uncharacterized protein LOC101858755 [Aplysia californica]
MMTAIKQEAVTEDYESQFYPQYEGHSTSLSTTSSFFSPELSASQVKVEAEEDDTSQSSSGVPPPPVKEPKKRGRPKKVRDDSGCSPDGEKKTPEKKMKQDTATDSLGVKKKRDRFNGMPEEEVLQRLLPDRLAHNLDIIIIGINPGLFAAYVGHHYAGPGNHFWKCLYLSGLIPEPMNAYDDFKLLDFGIGFTNICARTTRGSSDLKRVEIKEGAEILKRKILEYKPKIAVFNGKGIYEVFSGNKNFHIGKQPDKLERSDTVFYVMPSSSARCAQLPRALDKVPFYLGLKKLRDYLRGDLATLDESEVVFPTGALEQKPKAEVKDEGKELDEDEGSRSSLVCSKDLTLEQIQMQAEYQEALIASAEGMDFPEDVWSQGQSSFGRRKSGVKNGDIDYQLPGSFSPFDSAFQSSAVGQALSKSAQSAQSAKELGSAGSMGVTIKQEFPFNADEYESVAVKGPTAQKVNLDASIPDPYQCHISSSPQYISLGELPSRSKSAKKNDSNKEKSGGGGGRIAASSPSSNGQCSSSSSSSSSGKGSMFQHSHLSQQHSFTKILQSPFSHPDAGLLNLKQPKISDKGVRNLLA